MKICKCPLCRSEKIKKTDIDPQNNVHKKECKNKDKGCNTNLYHFDDEHEEDCIYNPLCCKFCNTNIVDNVDTHFESICVNSFNISKYTYPKTTSETTCRKFVVNIRTNLSLLNIDDQYFVMIVPKMSQKKFDFYAFSTKDKYKLSNYKIKILSPTNATLLELPIYYNRMRNTSIPFEALNNSLNFTLENMFILNRKEPTQTTYGNTTVFETYGVACEPGSAGNWTYEEYEEILSSMSGLFDV